MALFLRQTKKKKGVYLQIYNSVYDKKTKKKRSENFKKLGYVKDLITESIKDPIQYYKNKIKILNERNKKLLLEQKKILIDENSSKNFGYFLLKAAFNTIDAQRIFDLIQRNLDFDYPIFSLIESLVYSRVIQPCSKLKTYQDVLPNLFEKYDFSLNQIYYGLSWIGENYEDLIEVLNERVTTRFKRDTSKTYFDCTNYYFEIDFEKDDKQKGPSKENRHDPIIGQALMLDGNGIPLWMKMYPGNESEKNKLRGMINYLKERNIIPQKTIQVADKGLNCGDNIYEALNNLDGYIFSQSVSQLPEKEKKWVLSENDYREIRSGSETIYKIKSCIDDFEINVTDSKGKKLKMKEKQKRVVTFNKNLRDKKIYEINKLVEKAKKLFYSQAKKSEYGESSKYINFIGEDGKKVATKINYSKIEEDKKIAGYNLLVTSELNMKDEEVSSIYHNLWKIEETFKILKSQLESRPVYLQKKETIYGHFLICFYAITLLRILEIKVFKNKFNYNQIIDMIRKLNALKIDENKFINITKKSDEIFSLASELGEPINFKFLEQKDFAKLFRKKFVDQKKY